MKRSEGTAARRFRRQSHLLAPAIFVICASLACAACNRGQASAASDAPTYIPTATIKDLMQSIVDPSADIVWNSVTTVQSVEGTVDNAPKTDDDWAKVRHGAIALSEAANLLMMPGRH